MMQLPKEAITRPALDKLKPLACAKIVVLDVAIITPLRHVTYKDKMTSKFHFHDFDSIMKS